MTDLPPDAHEGEDPNGKVDVSGFQHGFLEGCAEALAAGFEAGDVEPESIEDPAKVDAIWADAG